MTELQRWLLALGVAFVMAGAGKMLHIPDYLSGWWSACAFLFITGQTRWRERD